MNLFINKAIYSLPTATSYIWYLIYEMNNEMKVQRNHLRNILD